MHSERSDGGVPPQAGYRTLFGRVRGGVRSLIAKQLELPKQEIAEILRANLAAAKMFAIAVLFGLLAAIALVVLLVSILALLLPWPLAALVVLVVLAALAGLFGYLGAQRVELRGPTRSIESLKETIEWAKARLLGRSAS